MISSARGSSAPSTGRTSRSRQSAHRYALAPTPPTFSPSWYRQGGVVLSRPSRRWSRAPSWPPSKVFECLLGPISTAASPETVCREAWEGPLLNPPSNLPGLNAISGMLFEMLWQWKDTQEYHWLGNIHV